MKVTDLSEDYVRFQSGKSSREDYVANHPEFFEHYFAYWGKKMLDFAKLSNPQIEEKRGLISASIALAKTKLESAKFDLSELEVVLFVGQNTTNGHGCIIDGRPTAFIAIECYKTEPYSNVFCLHEMIHALHYWANPSVYFQNESEKNSIGRQLLTEGVATHLTKALLGTNNNEALWADYLDEKSLEVWNNLYIQHRSKLIDKCLDWFDSSHTNQSEMLFQISDINDPMGSRMGYKIGLELIEFIVSTNGFSLTEVMQIDKEQLGDVLESQMARVRD